jgi:hypothetical protein
MILKIFSPKNSAKMLAFLTQNKSKLYKILIITLVYEKNAKFFAENCRKSQIGRIFAHRVIVFWTVT